MNPDIKNRIDFLRKELKRHNDLYYKQSQPEISDFDFDQMLKELAILEAENPDYIDLASPTLRVGSDLSNDFKQKKHKYPMLSLSNTYSYEEVREFVARCQKSLGEDIKICAEIKYDGTSISISYDGGYLQQAVTRGDGVQGDDVSNNVRTIRSVPLEIGDKEGMEVRGEILLPWKEFDRINAEREDKGEMLFANPRNAASGTIKLLNSRVVASRKLDVVFYALMEDKLPYDSHYANLQHLKQQGFHVSSDTKLCSNVEEVIEFIEMWDEKRKGLPVATDGIVLKVDSIRQQDELGITSKFPRWAVAYKFKAEQAESILREVTFQVGRTGSVTPVANMDPVQLSGTMVKRASLYNEDAIKALDLHIGDTCYIEKGGEIIPKIVGVDKSRRPEGAKPVVFITNCPECGAKLTRVEGESAYFCPNANHCPPQVQGRIEHFVARKAMNIDGIGPETITAFIKDGLIENYSDLYKLTDESIMACRRDIEAEMEVVQTELFPSEDLPQASKKKTTKPRKFTKLMATKIIKAIDQSKEVPFERVLFALGIRFVGETVAKRLASAFGNIDALIEADFEALVAVDEIGEKIAQSIKEHFAQEENIRIVETLRAHGLQMELNESDQPTQVSDALQGKTVVVSGVFSQYSRDEYKSMIEQNGGKVGSSISSKTSYVLAGENMGPSKLEKAQKLGIEILDEEQFLDILHKN